MSLLLSRNKLCVALCFCAGFVILFSRFSVVILHQEPFAIGVQRKYLDKVSISEERVGKLVYVHRNYCENSTWAAVLNLWHSAFNSSVEVYSPFASFDTRAWSSDILANVVRVLTLVERPDSHASVSCPRALVTLENFSVPLTGLLSYPGSGNTWTRHLIQQLTGFYTGTVYKEKYVAAFGKEGIHDRIVVKTHGASHHRSHIPKNMSRQILLIRNPFSAMAAEYKRGILKLGHTKTGDIDPKSDAWKKYVRAVIMKWKTFVQMSLSSDMPTLIIFYEDLKSCLIPELFHIAHFLRNDKVTQFSFFCPMKNNNGIAKRPQKSVEVSKIYSSLHRQQMNQVLDDLAKGFKRAYPVLAERLIQYKMLN